MKLHCVGSSSAGNCYILQNNTEALVLEAGVRFSDVQKALDFNVQKVVGCLITHEHGDHASQVSRFLDSCINVYMSAGTADALRLANNPFVSTVKSLSQYKVGNFSVMPFDVKHDAAEPLGFLVSHPETGVVLFATDTYYLPKRFFGLNHIMIECNYIEENLQYNLKNGTVSDNVAKRVHSSHMELQTCVGALKSNNLNAVRNIVLMHLSHSNGNGDIMKKTITEATGKNVVIARPGLIMDFNKNAF